MNILVTGSAGRIGRYIVRDLVDAGHRVTGADVSLPANNSNSTSAPTLQVDLTRAGEVYGALARAEAEAVVHMGAWANAGMVVDTRTYGDNVSATYNVFQACADLGIRHVISASTNQIYGFAQAPPLYVPVDENHLLRPVNCYALSKMAGEQAADYFVQNYGMTILAFRIMGTRTPMQLALEIEAMAAEPASGSWLLWSRTDARDVARACRLALEKLARGEAIESGAYNLTGSQVLGTSMVDLVRQHFGDATEIRGDLSPHLSLLSTEKARAAFGYEPHFVWTESQSHPE